MSKEERPLYKPSKSRTQMIRELQEHEARTKPASQTIEQKAMEVYSKLPVEHRMGLKTQVMKHLVTSGQPNINLEAFSKAVTEVYKEFGGRFPPVRDIRKAGIQGYADLEKRVLIDVQVGKRRTDVEQVWVRIVTGTPLKGSGAVDAEPRHCNLRLGQMVSFEATDKFPIPRFKRVQKRKNAKPLLIEDVARSLSRSMGRLVTSADCTALAKVS